MKYEIVSVRVLVCLFVSVVTYNFYYFSKLAFPEPARGGGVIGLPWVECNITATCRIFFWNMVFGDRLTNNFWLKLAVGLSSTK